MQDTNELFELNHFIDNLDMVELPLVGNKFTWIKPDGFMMSRLDRGLLLESWM